MVLNSREINYKWQQQSNMHLAEKNASFLWLTSNTKISLMHNIPSSIPFQVSHFMHRNGNSYVHACISSMHRCNNL